jgi:hypothetical protein
VPYKDFDDGHRTGIDGDAMSHARQVFEQGLQLEAILLAHEYLEQRLNALHGQQDTIHRKFKQLIDIFRSQGMLEGADYATLNEFNRLRNVNSNQVLNAALTLRGAKKGDMVKAMNLAYECDQAISRIKPRRKKQQRRQKS